MVTVKEVTDVIVKPLSHIFHLSFQRETFPQKIAKVVLLYKAGDEYCFNNYRSVLILPQFAKILEKVSSKRLDSFIDKPAILTVCMGFGQEDQTKFMLFG